jgi:hypothetical protein
MTQLGFDPAHLIGVPVRVPLFHFKEPSSLHQNVWLCPEIALLLTLVRQN